MACDAVRCPSTSAPVCFGVGAAVLEGTPGRGQRVGLWFANTRLSVHGG